MKTDFSIEQLDELEHCLAGFCERADADLALLTDETGQAIVSGGAIRGIEAASLAALAAANLAATMAIARKVGEKSSCRSMLYEGEIKRIYVTASPGELVLLIVTRSDVPIGAVRFFLQETLRSIETITSVERAPEFTEALLDEGFDLEDGLSSLFADTFDGEEPASDNH